MCDVEPEIVSSYFIPAAERNQINIIVIKWASALDFQQRVMCDQQSLRSACAYAQSDQSLC